MPAEATTSLLDRPPSHENPTYLFNPVLPPPIDIHRLLRETFVAQVQHYVTLESTNDYAKSLAARQPGDLPLLIVADRQTAGRGRGANRWWTGQGSLAFSLLVDLRAMGVARPRWPLVALAAGVAVVETVTPLIPDRTVGLHWPNDVYADGRKLSGILVELSSDRLCVVGIGLNVNNSLHNAPGELRESATTLRELTGATYDPTEVLVHVLSALKSRLEGLAQESVVLTKRANDLCLQHGRVLTVRQGQRSITGRCVGIDTDGGLLLETPAGQEKVFSGTLR